MSWGPWRAPTEPKLTAVEPRHPRKRLLIRGNPLERMTGIEPALSAWEADVLPLNYIRVTRRFTLRCVPSYPTRDLRNDLRTFGATCVRVTQAHAMEGNPGKRLIAPRPRMCAVEAQRCVDCVSAVLQAGLTRGPTLRPVFDANRRAWRSWTRCALGDDHLLVDDDRELRR
jgi:hypothetical protein